MIRHSFFSLSLLAAAVWSSGAGAQLRNDPVLIAGGDPTGIYFQAAGAVCRVMEQTEAGRERGCAVLPTHGSIDNLRILKEGSADFAVVQADTQFTAMVGSRPYAFNVRFEKLNSVLGLYKEDLAVVVGNDSGIESFEDLKGKKFGVGPEGSGTEHFLSIIMQGAGFTEADMDNFVAVDAFDMTKALCDGQVDAVAFVAGHPNLAVERALENCDAKLLPITGDAFDLMTDGFPFIERSEIPAEVYAGLEANVPTLSVRAVLVSREDVPPDTVGELATAVFETLPTLKLNYPRFFQLTPESMTEGDLYAPLHQGVEDAITPKSN